MNTTLDTHDVLTCSVGWNEKNQRTNWEIASLRALSNMITDTLFQHGISQITTQHTITKFALAILQKSIKSQVGNQSHRELMNSSISQLKRVIN